MADQQPTDVEGQLRVALDNMPGALAYTDGDLNIVFCNDRFKEMYRVPQELLQPGRPYSDFLRYLAENGYYGDGDVGTLVARRVESLRNPSGMSFEDHTPDGRWYRILRRRVAGGGAVTVMTDITEQKMQIEAEPVGELSLIGFQRPVLAHNVLAVLPTGPDWGGQNAVSGGTMAD